MLRRRAAIGLLFAITSYESAMDARDEKRMGDGEQGRRGGSGPSFAIVLRKGEMGLLEVLEVDEVVVWMGGW